VTKILSTSLPRWSEMLAVGAHPDDESFGMGAVLAPFAQGETRITVLSFTRGEASTLHDARGARALRLEGGWSEWSAEQPRQ